MDTASLSPEFESGMKNMLGDDYENFRQSLSGAPPVSIRVNPAKACDLALDQPVPWTRHATYLSDRPVFTLDPRFHAGAYYVQEASSMFLEQAICQHTDTCEALNVLDLCAAPGGKATHLLSLLRDDSLLVANEPIRTRVASLEENIERWGKDNVVLCRSDPAAFGRLPGFFDVIVVDAPCSGEGLFRKDPKAQQQWNPDRMSQCAARQKRILADVWPALKEGGILIYSTCTYSMAENEENVRWLCDEHGAESLPLAIDDSWGVVRSLDVAGYRFFPHRLKGEGFFLSVLRKTAPSVQFRNGKIKSTLTRPPRDNLGKLVPWVCAPENKHFFVHRDQLRFLTAGKVHEAEYIIQQLGAVAAGTAAATVKHGKLIPEHPLALSLSFNRDNVEAFEVDESSALRLLRKESVHLPGAAKGFAVVTYRGLVLGWVNVVAGRVNNLYPSQRRIRMSLPNGSN